MPEIPGGKLVGRDAEFARLLGLLDAAAAGRPVVALVSGDAGVGKTRLVTEIAREARERGFAVLLGRCAELADTIPYLPLADALRDAATSPSAHGPLLDALAARPVLLRLLPDWEESAPGRGDMPGLAQQQLFGAVLGMLAELAGASPVLLILEDMHWADGSVRDLVTFLSRVLHRERLAMVVTYRTDDLHRQHPLRPVVGELLRLPSVTAVSLGPLDPSAMAEHLTALSGRPLDVTALGQVITRAEGNAYYAEELLAAMAAGSALPAGLADLLVARMDRLSATARQVLRVAAVTGRRVDDELVMQAAGLAAAEYEEAVREAVAHQLLVLAGARDYAFRHALLREAIYADLLPGERTRLHARLAMLLSDERRIAGVPGTAAELAHHCLASHDLPGAFAASIRAGREAERLLAPAEAHRHYDQALSLWERVGEPKLLATRASVLLAMQDLGPALSRAQQAQAAARAADADRVEADAMVTLGLISEQDGRHEEAIGLFSGAREKARGSTLGAELRAMFQLSRVQLELGDLAGAAGPAHEGTRRAQEAGLGLAPYGLDLRYLHYLLHYADGAWDHAQRIADDFAVRVTSVAEARLSAMALFVDVARGRASVQERRDWLEPFFAADRFAEYVGRGVLAEHALWQGDLEAAIAGAEAADRLGIASNLLTTRLGTLVEAGVMRRVAYREPGGRQRHEYRLTERGADLRPVLVALMEWGDRYLAGPQGPPAIVRHQAGAGEAACEEPVRLVLECAGGHSRLPPGALRRTPGPGAHATTPA